VVNEYGDIAGLVTLEQILEEIVGKFTTLAPGIDKGLIKQKDGGYVVTGNTSIRDLNRALDWKLPTDEAKTINGLILEELQEIPQTNMSFRYNDFIFEIMQTRGTTVQSVRIRNLAES
jgi:Mg2+/Co2+ transporter CorB